MLIFRYPAYWILFISAAILPFFSLPIYFEPHDTGKWTLVYIAVLLAFSLHLVVSKKPIKIPLLRRETLLFFLLLIFTALQIPLLDLSFTHKNLIDRLIFALLFLLIYNWPQEKKNYLLPLLAVTASVVSIICVHWIFTHFDYRRYQYSPNFGNINMSAQFCGVACLLLLNSMSKSLKRSWWLEVGFILSANLILFSGCRSTLIGVTAGLGFLTVFKFKFARHLFRPLIASLLLFVTLIFVFKPFDAKMGVWTNIENSKSYRLQLWQSAWLLFLDRPFGVGQYRFTFDVMPYKMKVGQTPREGEVDFYAHNEFFRYLTEDGIQGFLVVLTLLGLFIWRNFKLPDKETKLLNFALLLFLASESVFQFPFELPVPFILAAWMASQTLKQNESFTTKNLQWAFLLPIGLLVFLCTRFLVSEYAAFKLRDNRSAIIRGCELNTNNWRACLFSANLLIEAGEFIKGEEFLANILKKQPYHFPALKHMSKSAFRQGDWPKGCRYLAEYDRILGGKSELHHWLTQKCVFP